MTPRRGNRAGGAVHWASADVSSPPGRPSSRFAVAGRRKSGWDVSRTSMYFHAPLLRARSALNSELKAPAKDAVVGGRRGSRPTRQRRPRPGALGAANGDALSASVDATHKPACSSGQTQGPQRRTSLRGVYGSPHSACSSAARRSPGYQLSDSCRAEMTLRRWARVLASAAALSRRAMASMIARCSGNETWGRPGRSARRNWCRTI